MNTQKDEVLKKALSLPPIERVELVEDILSSFDFPERERVDALWVAEAEDRLNAYNSGRMKSIPAKEVFDKIDRNAQS